MSKLMGPEASTTGVAEGVKVGAGVGVDVGAGEGVGVGVGAGVGVDVGLGVGVTSTTSVTRFRPLDSVHRMAPIASMRTAATPMESTSTGDTPRFGPTGSSGEPHSGHRKSLVTTVIFSFRYANLQPE
ncbi:MAG: hypothetical protein JOZ21_03200 [Verrucomicrobia bacterium]|nr:hypothetical protein [Verrucomicrobiota bacterium]